MSVLTEAETGLILLAKQNHAMLVSGVQTLLGGKSEQSDNISNASD